MVGWSPLVVILCLIDASNGLPASVKSARDSCIAVATGNSSDTTWTVSLPICSYCIGMTWPVASFSGSMMIYRWKSLSSIGVDGARVEVASISVSEVSIISFVIVYIGGVLVGGDIGRYFVDRCYIFFFCGCRR